MKFKRKVQSDAKLWKWFSIFIRLRDADSQGFGKCFTCPRVIHWKQGDCGHGIGRQHKATKYNEQNNHLQCKKCNGFEGGMREVYKEEMDKRYGAGSWDRMSVLAKSSLKRGQVDIDVLTEYYKSKAEELLKSQAA